MLLKVLHKFPNALQMEGGLWVTAWLAGAGRPQGRVEVLGPAPPHPLPHPTTDSLVS